MTPASTYRLQLSPEFTLFQAAALVPYLSALGVTHVYCSPWLQATPGSTHGYDVVDHLQVAVDLGGSEGLAALVTAARQHNLGIVLDVVPNHMHVPNPKWDDVRRQGQASPFARWFDIDWTAAGFDAAHADDPDPRAGLPPYRRFFDIDSLAAVRVEDTGVFGTTHSLVLQQCRAGVVDGLRLDHVDGLADPARYLEDLAQATGQTWTVVEKILAPDERLPSAWRCAGTTGYDALAALTQLFADSTGTAALTETYAGFTGAEHDWVVLAADARREMTHALAPDIDRVVRNLAEATRMAEAEIRPAVIELLVTLPVYRLDITPDQPVPPPTKALLQSVATEVTARCPSLAPAVDAAVTALLTAPGDIAARFGQISGPVMAKGQEDTAFYRYHRLIALCEVGAEPGHVGWSLDEFHEFARQLSAHWPRSMTTLSTHDTKRSEDVRARLVVLSEIPQEWHTAVTALSAAAARHRRPAGPDANTEYLIWQTLVGAWPLSADRATAYFAKATREAKQHTAWVDGNPAYDAAVHDFVVDVLGDETVRAALEAFVARIEPAARSNSLAQKLVQLTMPGVADVYQGNESRRFDLVDPDNRRPVDYAALQESLSAGSDPKQRVVAAALRLRRAHPEMFLSGESYAPLRASGLAADHVVAFARGTQQTGLAVTIAPRHTEGVRRAGSWQDTAVTLPPGRFVDVFTGAEWVGTVPVTDVVARFPVALLTTGVEPSATG